MAISEAIKKALNSDKVYDLSFDGLNSSNGWKISIVGKKMDDIYDLYERLHGFLDRHNIAHKIGTRKRLEAKVAEQNRKLVTIYVPNKVDINKLLLKVEYLLKGYTGWHGIRLPFTGYQVYAGGICVRNDRDEYGDYIPGKDAK